MLEFVATNAEQVVPWALGLVALLLTKYVWSTIAHKTAREILQRAWNEVADAVMETWQTYTSELKRARADGLLTEAEKLEAKRRAVATAKSNIGVKGLKRLANVLGFSSFFGEAPEKVDAWIESKTEVALASLKSSGVLKNGVAPGVIAVPAKPLTRNPS
ncbi:MAG: hypothetical protein K8M05_19105 [Deltaproteobacteria bacterium]|nr:hypothetical protein [Kofleriaceae bacterium]